MLRVGITHGDINGISYEVILKALADDRITELCTPVIFGSPKLVAYYKKTLGIDTFQANQISSPSQAKDGAINIYNISDSELKVDMGRPTPESGHAALLALESAVEALKKGEIDVLVTAPINKNAIHGADFPFNGHTEYLQARLCPVQESADTEEEDEKTVQQERDRKEALMILFADTLRVALVTTHLPLAEVPKAITKDLVMRRLRQFNDSLILDFGLTRPRIAVLSLNPHAGDNGLLGNEEEEIIKPAIAEAFDAGIMAFGPYPADGLFGLGDYTKFDGILAMYHDQGLAPFKLAAGDSGVNFTAGLPYVRTSPDHGTGYDIAGKNIASPESMRQAIYAAIDIYRCRASLMAVGTRPLRKQYVERGADKTVDLSKDTDL